MGSIRTERIKLRHQDVMYSVVYRKGKLNQSDYISRHAKPIERMSLQIQREAEENTNLLYVLHSTPIIDCISLTTIATETSSDKTL